MFYKKNKLYLITRSGFKIEEGGVVRENAIYNQLKKTSIVIKLGKSRLLNTTKLFIFLFFSKKNKIFMHYPFARILLSNKFFFLSFFRFIFIKLLIRAQKNNQIYFDVADLPVEQAKDLELNIPSYYDEIDKYIFNNKSTYIFASNSMKNYAVKKFKLLDKNTMVWINGGNSVQKNIDLNKIKTVIDKIDTNKINYIYAGTLNKGRQIEAILKLFNGLVNHNLILIGIGGNWINELTLSKNIMYLGALEQDDAHYLVSLCDVGLVPYDANRDYYNIAYPTKLSFYITAGIAFLSTPVAEAQKVHEQYKIGYVEEIDNWNDFIFNLNKKDIVESKIAISKVKDKFLWGNIINKNDIIGNNE